MRPDYDSSVYDLERSTVECSHCGGSGECDCAACAGYWAQFNVGSARDDFDTWRIQEGTCRICCGMGRTNRDGTPLIDEPSFG